MKCLECGKESEWKYCSSKCGNSFRVKMFRLKSHEVNGATKEENEKVLEEIKEIVEPVVEPSIVKGEISEADRNTIRDPNPDWTPGKIITSSNRTMECPYCGKLSLTHRKMCSPEARSYGYNDCYNIK